MRNIQNDRVSLVEHSVNAHVLLGDSTTQQVINRGVHIHLKFNSPSNQTFQEELFCYVLDSPATTEIIVGLPTILGTSFYHLFKEILEEGYYSLGQSETMSKIKTAQHLHLIDEIKQLLIPWPAVLEPIAPEELDTITPDSFPDALHFLTGTKEEVEKKYVDDLHNHIDPAWIAHCKDQQTESIADFLNSPLIRQTFLPTSWDGFKNVRQCGANSNDEFELDWSEDFPSSLDSKVRPIPPRLAEVVKTEFDRLHGYFWADSDSPVCCPLTIAPKATVPFIRVAADLRHVNPYIHTPKEYIPNVKTEVMKMQRFTVFADLDHTNSFHQIKLGYLSSRRLTVKTHLGLKRPLFVPEGVSPGSALL